MRRCLEQLAEDLVARDAESLRDRLEHLAALHPWLNLERFDRRQVNQRLRRYAQGERLELQLFPSGLTQWRIHPRSGGKGLAGERPAPPFNRKRSL
jgi:hypothetical protein